MSKKTIVQYSRQEEFFNSFSHGVGAVLAVFGFVVLMIYTKNDQTVLRRLTFILYTIPLIMLYLSSTLYHAFSQQELKYFFRKLDHVSIFLLIAGTYTPICLLGLKGTTGWWLFGFIWGLAAVGICHKLLFYKWNKWLTVVVYVAMGWSCVVTLKPMLERLPEGLLMYLLAGGLAYTGGTAFYLKKSMKHHHFIWHLFVLAGSVFHFLGVLIYLAK